ncbi:MAG: HutD family protein [Ramlibacter sp.]|jgi:environmental stress-induced protein Ves|nr:HutD family protein [Ramlibacter sp.]
MSWNLLRLDEVAATPWRNGGGVTRELLAWPQARDWRVRMSVAEVARDGPFSRFDGVQRWFAVLDGAGVRLRIHGATHELTQRSAPFAFDGAVATDCALIAGATQDFNLMLRGADGRMGRVRGTRSLDCSAMRLIAIYAGPGAARAGFGDEQVEIGPRTLAWRILEADGHLRIDSPDALWMEIKP